MPHCVLLGDSIFDNGSYTRGGPAVIDQLRSQLPAGWSATLLAVDGSTTADLPGQLARLPAEATHLVVSIGGNDALLASGLVQQRAGTVGEALTQLAQAMQTFAASYRRAMQAVIAAGKPAVFCTIYDPLFPDPAYQTTLTAGLAHFNDAIIRQVGAGGMPLIDLRHVCTAAGDYANEIEPSSAGGAKIARAIAHALAAHDFSTQGTVVYF